MWKKTYTRKFGPIFEYCNDMLSTMISKDSFSFEFEMRITTRLCLDSTAKSYCRALCFWIYCRQVSKDSAWFKKQEVTVCVCVCVCTCVFASTYRCSHHSSHLFWMHIWVGCHPFALTTPLRNSHRSIPTCLLQCVSRICMALVCLQ